MGIWTTLLPFLGAVIGAMIGATVSPLVQWQIEKKRQKLTYKRELISRWRKMFERYNSDKNSGLDDEVILGWLMKEGDFATFMAYSKVSGSHQLPEEEKESVENAGIHPLIYMYLRETARLEKEWKLI
jgi:hypothetical protein